MSVAIVHHRPVWINHFCLRPPAQGWLVQMRGGSDWPFLVRVGRSEYWWSRVYKTRRSAISALGGEARALKGKKP